MDQRNKVREQRERNGAEVFKNCSSTLLFLFITLETSEMSLLCFCPAHLEWSLVNQKVQAGRRLCFPPQSLFEKFFVSAVVFFECSAIFLLWLLIQPPSPDIYV